MLVLAGVHAVKGVQGEFRRPVPLTLDRCQRLTGFSSHDAPAGGFRRIAALGLGRHDARSPRDYEGRRLRGVAQTIGLRSYLFSEKPDSQRERDVAREMGRGGLVLYPAFWFYRGFIASLPTGASRYVFIIIRAWEGVQDVDAYVERICAASRMSEAEARMQVQARRTDGAVSVQQWAERAGMDVRVFRSALRVLTQATLSGGTTPYVTVGGEWTEPDAPCWITTTPLQGHTPPLTYEQLNAPWAKVTAARRAIFGKSDA